MLTSWLRRCDSVGGERPKRSGYDTGVVTGPSSCTSTNERVYSTAMAAKLDWVEPAGYRPPRRVPLPQR